MELLNVKMGRSLLLHVLCCLVLYILNRLPSRVLDFQTPMQNQRSKLDLCALRCVFLGFSPHQKGYRCYHPATRRLYVSMDVTFIEDKIWNHGVPPDRYSPEGKAGYAIAHFVSDHKLSPECKAFVTRMDGIKISTRVEEAFNDPKWAEAMNIEMEVLQKNNTWDIVDLPKGTKPVGCRWVFTVKYNANGIVERYKARLVAKGFTHTYGVDYHDTFAHVAKMNTVRVLLSLAVNLDWTLRQFDALYGLKQSPRAWFGKFTIAMKKFGVEVTRSKHGLFLSQRKYVMDLLADTGMLDCKPVDTPIVENHKLGVYMDQVPTNKERYQRLVGRLIYLSLTCPDIAYAVSFASQFMHSPSEDHMATVMHILNYLKSAPGRDRRSTSGYFTFVGGNLVTWRSKKQNVVSRSSAESEYKGIAQGVCEILWLRWLLAEIGFRPNAATKLHCENQSAFEIANNLVQHDRTKHVEVDRHFIKEKLEHKLIYIPFVPSSEQLADMLTHAISKRRFEDSLDKLGITDIYAPT
ncbi:unnamed protein product [Prunus armeniaca]